MYTYHFDRSSLALLLSGVFVAVVLIVAAGLLIGLRIDRARAPIQTPGFESLASFEGGLVRSATAAPPRALISEGFPGYLATIRRSGGGTLTALCFGGYPTLQGALVDARRYLAGGRGREAILHAAEPSSFPGR